MRKILADEFHREMRAQGAADRQDIAFKCVACGTVQSMRSMIDAGMSDKGAESAIGFSCEGRMRGAKAATREGKPADPNVRGCDWSLGGLFRIHELEVTTPDGAVHPTFELASAEEMAALRDMMTARKGEG